MFTEGLAFVLPAIADRLVIVLLSIVVLVLAPLEAAVAVVTFAVAALGYRRLIYRRTGLASAALHEDHRLSYSIANESLRAVPRRSRSCRLRRTSSVDLTSCVIGWAMPNGRSR